MYAPLDGPWGANSVLIIVIFNTDAPVLLQFAVAFMQVNYNCIPESSHVSRVHNAAILWLQIVAHVMLLHILHVLYFYIITFQIACAVRNMAVFCSSLMSCFPGMLLRYLVNDSETLPVVPVINCITSVFTFHKFCISVVTSPYFKIFSASFFISYLSSEIVVLLTFWRRNYFFNFSTPCILYVNNTGIKYVRFMKQTAFWRGRNGEYIPCLNYSVPIFVE